MKLSDEAAQALRGAVASTGKFKGRLKASPPNSTTMAYAAWMGAMLAINPFKVRVGGVLLMSAEQRAIMNEVTAMIESLPTTWQIAMDRDRASLEKLGVW